MFLFLHPRAIRWRGDSGFSLFVGSFFFSQPLRFSTLQPRKTLCGLFGKRFRPGPFCSSAFLQQPCPLSYFSGVHIGSASLLPSARCLFFFLLPLSFFRLDTALIPSSTKQRKTTSLLSEPSHRNLSTTSASTRSSSFPIWVF